MSDETTEVAKPKAALTVSRGGIEINSLDSMVRFCDMVVATSLCPDDVRKATNPKIEALARVQMGMEVGLTPMFALRSVAVINGRPCIWGNGLRALVQAQPSCTKFEEGFEGEPGTEDYASYCTIGRKGRGDTTIWFSVKDAKLAGLWGKNVWAKYPNDMMRGKSMSRCAQSVFADALGGLISDQEAADSPPEPRDVTDSADDAPISDLSQLTERLANEQSAKDDSAQSEPEAAAEAADEVAEEGSVVSGAEEKVAPSSEEDSSGDGEVQDDAYEACVECKSMFLKEAESLNEHGLCDNCRPKQKARRRREPA